jgi:DNA-directed RNA polymerase subunit beta
MVDLIEAGHDEIKTSRHRSHQCRRLHPQHAGGRQEPLPRGRAVRHLPRDASGRAADHGNGRSLFQSLFFDSERYDLSAVGRVKMNMRLDLDAEDTQRVLRKEDIIAVLKHAGRPA